jgi:6-phosphogluconolactonase
MPHPPDFRVVEDAAQVARNAAEWLVDACARAIEARGRCQLVLAGGTTPAAAYRAFAQKHVAWDKVHFGLGDERAVPADHDDANVRMAKECLAPAIAAGAVLHPIEGVERDPVGAARSYAEIFPVPDVVTLGMGEDGHTASLFPHHLALHEQHARVIAIEGSPKPPPRRVTITRRVIIEARELLVLVSGGKKASALAQVVAGGTAEELPIRLAARPHAIWLVDRAAWAKVAR